jgi:hypothetical protein
MPLIWMLKCVNPTVPTCLAWSYFSPYSWFTLLGHWVHQHSWLLMIKVGVITQRIVASLFHVGWFDCNWPRPTWTFNLLYLSDKSTRKNQPNISIGGFKSTYYAHSNFGLLCFSELDSKASKLFRFCNFCTFVLDNNWNN